MSISLFSRQLAGRLGAAVRLPQQHQHQQQQSLRRSHGYVVLVPEIGDDLPDTDPHLRADGLPEFSNVTIERCIATIGRQALDVEKTVQQCEQRLLESASGSIDLFADVLRPIEASEAQLEITWGLAKCLYLGNSSLMPTKSYAQIDERARKARFQKFTSAPLYGAVAAALRRPAAATEFTAEQLRVLQKYEREGRLNGVALAEADRAVLAETMEKLRQQRAKFAGNVEQAVRQFRHTVQDYAVVRDFPADVLQSLAADPAQPTDGPWTVTLAPTTYARFLEHCPDRTLRWNVWQAQQRKCSGHANTSFSNSVHLEEIRSLRHRQAQLLGYPSFADMSMATKMAGSVAEVRSLLDGLLAAARPAQERELADLAAFAAKAGSDHALEPCDIPYWRRKWLRSTNPALDDEAIREYFPLPGVLAGCLRLLGDQFGVRFEQREQPAVVGWHPDVQFYDVFEGDAVEPIAGFYLDLYARDADKLRQRHGNVVGIGGFGSGQSHSSSGQRGPLAALVFDFAPPLYGKPTLCGYAEVRQLLQRFGHAMQALLTRARHPDVAGWSNVEWDAVGVCGEVAAGLVRADGVLESLSGHYASGERLPADRRLALVASERQMAGWEMSQELWRASVDVELYSKERQRVFWLEVVRELWPRYQVLGLDKKAAEPCGWTEVVAGGWAAAWYGHVWSRVVAADVCGAFEEARAAAPAGDADEQVRQVGRRFRETFLALGGARHAGEVFREFRGRDPSTRALLRQLGLEGISSSGQVADARTAEAPVATSEEDRKPVQVA